MLSLPINNQYHHGQIIMKATKPGIKENVGAKQAYLLLSVLPTQENDNHELKLYNEGEEEIFFYTR